MIELKELLDGADFSVLDKSIQANLMETLEKINKVRSKWNKPMTVTSPLRTMKHHLEIYAKKGVTDLSKIPMKSKHLFGQAVDIADPKGELGAWCKANEAWLLSIGIWMEDLSVTKGWCHFQIVQYGSWKPGKSMFFMP